MKLRYRIIALVLAIAVSLSLSGCAEIAGVIAVGLAGSDDSGGAVSGEVVFAPPASESLASVPEDSTAALTGAEPVYLRIGEEFDVATRVSSASEEGVVTESRCEEIASVSGSVIRGVSVGKTAVSVIRAGRVIAEFSVTVEFDALSTGFDFTTDLVDSTVYSVSSEYEANRIIDDAISKRYSRVTLDFSNISLLYDVSDDFEPELELGTHVSLFVTEHTFARYRADFTISYDSHAATVTTPKSGELEFRQILGYNEIIRRAYAISEAGGARPDNYNDFAIYTENKGSFAVHNSEELWWAVEQGYLPVFPIENTKAELLFERAKMILREIIVEGMTDYEKVISIYEYILNAVEYDHYAFDAAMETMAKGSYEEILALGQDKCYYLEGVFENGRAVCDGKAKAFVLLCGIEGIECVRVTGDAIEDGVGHAWNYVKIDYYWYLIDTTASDGLYLEENADSIADYCDGDVEVPSYEYFLRSVDYLRGEYDYHGMWYEIEEQLSFTQRNYFAYRLPGSNGMDFIISSANEVHRMFEMASEIGMPDEFVMSFISDQEEKAYEYFEEVIERYKLEVKMFYTVYDGRAVHVAHCKVLSADEWDR